MPSYAETRTLPYGQNDLFDLVADVESYPEFLPWCVGSKVFDRNERQFLATLTIGYGGLREDYTSRVELNPYSSIKATAVEGPFKYLINSWTFATAGHDRTAVSCVIDFELNSWLLSKALTPVLSVASRELLAAFEMRAAKKY